MLAPLSRALHVGSLAALVALGACAGTGRAADAPAEPLPTGSWRGGLVREGSAAPGLPATLSITEGPAVVLVAGAFRVTADDVDARDGRLRFRAPGFPVSRASRRTVRCDLDLAGARQGLAGRCQAGGAVHRLSLRRSSSY